MWTRKVKTFVMPHKTIHKSLAPLGVKSQQIIKISEFLRWNILPTVEECLSITTKDLITKDINEGARKEKIFSSPL